MLIRTAFTRDLKHSTIPWMGKICRWRRSKLIAVRGACKNRNMEQMTTNGRYNPVFTTTTGRKSCDCFETQQITFTALASRQRRGHLLTQCTYNLLRAFENAYFLAVIFKQCHGLSSTEKFPALTICITNISAPSNAAVKKWSQIFDL